MEKEFDIEGIILTNTEISEDQITDMFIEFVESNNWLLGGGIHPVETNVKFTIGIGVIVDEQVTYDIFYKRFNNFIESSMWKFNGNIIEINDGYYINKDGTKGKHVLDDMD